MSGAPYFLESKRLGFRHWTSADLPLARELWGDLAVTRFFGGPFSEAQIVERLQRELSRMESFNLQYWPMHLRSDGEFVGCCGIRPYRPSEEIHELGFHLRPKFWGQGLAGEAACTVMRYAFEVIKAKGLSAGHHPENLASKKLIEKLGFHYSHHEPWAILEMDIPYYLLLRPVA
jgi:ribosomal-protein-alanine N-acetyltransferase